MTDPYTRPVSDSAALVLIDIQRDFYADAVPGSAGSQIASELLPNPVELDHELSLNELQRVGPREHVMC